MRDRVSNIWEQSYPYVLGAVVGVGVWFLPINTAKVLEGRGFVAAAFYAALFNLNVFGAGVMISVFVFTQAPAAGFIARIDKLALFARFRRYLKEAIAVGLIAGVGCVPLSAASASAMELHTMAAMAVTVIALSACFIALSFRASQIFLFWASRN